MDDMVAFIAGIIIGLFLQPYFKYVVDALKKASKKPEEAN